MMRSNSNLMLNPVPNRVSVLRAVSKRLTAGALLLLAPVVVSVVSAAPLQLGEHEFISTPFGGPFSSTGLNGNSQVEDVSSDGRYIAFNTEGSFATATRGKPKSLIYDRTTGEIELVDPDPSWHSGNLMLHDDGRYVTFVSTSPDFVPDSANESLEQYGDLFTWDRQADTYTRLTTAFSIPVSKERAVTMSGDGERIVFSTGSPRRRNTDLPRVTAGTYVFERSTGSLDRVEDDIATGTRVFAPRISKNGEWLAYIEGPWGGAAGQIVLRNLNTGQRRVFPVNSAFSVRLHGFSNDGELLSFSEQNAEGQYVEYLYNSATDIKTQFLPSANGVVTSAVFSGDRRFVFFESTATNLVDAPDPNGSTPDLYRRELATGNTIRITRMKPGGLSAFSSNFDGSVVAFEDDANVYDVDDPNGGYSDVFVWTEGSSEFPRVSNTPKPYLVNGGNNHSDDPRVSADGRYIVFTSLASNLTANDNNELKDVFFYDRVTAEMRNVTAASNGIVTPPAMSADGQSVVFLSTGDNLGSGPIHGGWNLYLYDAAADEITNLSPAGVAWNISSMDVNISGDGNRIIFNTSQGLKVLDRALDRFIDLPYSNAFAATLSGDGGIALVSPIRSGDQFVELYDVAAGRMIDRSIVSSQSWVHPQMSDDAQKVLLNTQLDLYPGNGLIDKGLYLWDRSTGGYERLGTPGRGGEADNFTISRDGSVAVLQDNYAYDYRYRGYRNCGTPFTAPGIIYNLQDGTSRDLPCVREKNVNGRVADRPALSANGDLFVGAMHTRFIQTDVDTRDNLYVLRLAGEPDIETPIPTEFSAVQRAGSRIINVNASWPADAQWTQIRVWDDLSTVLWDGPALSFSGTYTVAPGLTSITFNSRYWVNGVELGNTDFTVELEAVASGQTLTGYAWIDSSADSIRDTDEPAEVGRQVDLFRCEAPWGRVDTVVSVAPDGKFSFANLDVGRYQIGTSAVGVEFTAPGNDNVVFSNGFSNCITVDGQQPDIGIGLLSADLPRISLTGFAWLDTNADSLRDASEAGDANRAVTMYRCEEPWGIAGNAVTDTTGNFVLTNVLPGKYQFGTEATGVSFSPVRRDNLIYANGFSNCVDFSAGPRPIGIGIVE